MLVTCIFCKAKINKDDAYADYSSKRNKYFCNQEHYDNYRKKQEKINKKRQKQIDAFNQKKSIYQQHFSPQEIELEGKYADEIYEFLLALKGGTFKSFGVLKKEWIVWNSMSSNKTILKYLQNNQDHLIRVMNDKEFTSEYAWIRYLSAILKNSLPKEIIEENAKPIDFTYSNGRQNKRKLRKGFDDLGG